MTLKERLLKYIIPNLVDAYLHSEKENKKEEMYYLNRFQSSLETNLFEWLASPVTFTENTLPSIPDLCTKYSYIIEAKSVEEFYFNLNKWLFKAEDLDTPAFPVIVLVATLAVQNYYRNLILKTYESKQE